MREKAVAHVGDVSSLADATEMVRLAVDTFGGLDVVVNNAGIQHVAPVEDFPPEKWEAIVAINLSSAFYGIRAVLPGMKARGWGRITSSAQSVPS